MTFSMLLPSLIAKTPCYIPIGYTTCDSLGWNFTHSFRLRRHNIITRIAQVPYIKILTWLWGFLLTYFDINLVWFSLQMCKSPRNCETMESWKIFNAMLALHSWCDPLILVSSRFKWVKAQPATLETNHPLKMNYFSRVLGKWFSSH